MRLLLIGALCFSLCAMVTAPEGLPSVKFCDGIDGSLASCPCSNPGDMLTGCDTPIPAMQGGGTTGGILLRATAQSTSPLNRVTMLATGFPAGSSPSGVLFRNNGIDPLSPIVFGDGLRCVDASSSPVTLVRIGGAIAISGQSVHTFGHGSMAGAGSFFYQLWFRSAPTSYCNPTAAFSLSNGETLHW